MEQGEAMPNSSVAKMAQNNLLHSKVPPSEIKVSERVSTKSIRSGYFLSSGPCVCGPQWVQGQLDGQTAIPKAEIARTTKWKRNATKQADLSRTAADILDVTAFPLSLRCLASHTPSHLIQRLSVSGAFAAQENSPFSCQARCQLSDTQRFVGSRSRI